MNFDYKRMLKFEHNVGAQDKKYRMIAGCALLAVAIVTAKIVLLLLGMVLVITAYSGWCPLYSGLGKNTACGACADTAAEQAGDATEQASEAPEQASEATEQAGEATEQAGEATEQASEATEQAGEATEQASEATEQASEATEQASEATPKE